MLKLDLSNVNYVEVETTKRDVLAKFADMAAANNCIESKEDFLKGLLEREEEFSTGIGSSIAIPHCKSTTVKEASVFIQKFKAPVEWEALDNEPVKLAICLVVPEEEAGTTHLKVLSNIARSLINKEFAVKLLNTDVKEELVELLKEVINK